MMNPEKEILRNLTIDQAYKKTQESLKSEVINLEQFKNLYGDEVIKQDQEYVEEMEARFSESRNPEQERVRKLAAIFEEIFHEHAEMSEWLGPNVLTIKTSRFDDIKNGIDSVAEFQENEVSASYLALAIDVTMSANAEKKFKRIKREIEHGRLATIKYFVSEHMNMRGELSNIPRIVIGADAKTIRELGELWLEKNNKALGNHPVQFQILEEILSQLDAFRSYAETVNQPILVSIYSKMKGIVEKIKEEKLSSVSDSGYRDSVFYGLQDYLSNFSRL